MSKLNPKVSAEPLPNLAGGMGNRAARQSPEMELRRMVMAALLWEDLAYVDGKTAADEIVKLIPKVNPATVAAITLATRKEQKLRHMPLFLIREMARLDDYKQYVGELLPQICTRADMVTDFLALYWKDGKCPLSAQVKKGLAKALMRFDEYQLAKYNREAGVQLRDVLFLTHARPPQEKVDLFNRLANGELRTPDTWEVSLSSGQDKKETWERLITEGKLGANAFLKNLRSFERAGVSEQVMLHGFNNIQSNMLLPIDFLKAQTAAPKWVREIEQMMFRCFAEAPKLSGTTAFVVDVSGSMGNRLSIQSEYTRIDVAAAMTMLAAEQCDRIKVYATAGSDGRKVHQTEAIKPYRGFALADEIKEAKHRLGGGGIFTRQCLEYIREQERETPDRIVIFSDSQDCDYPDKRKPAPFGRYNYIIDVSAHQHGINYQGVWDSEIAGWSEHFLKYIALYEQQFSSP